MPSSRAAPSYCGPSDLGKEMEECTGSTSAPATRSVSRARARSPWAYRVIKGVAEPRLTAAKTTTRRKHAQYRSVASGRRVSQGVSHAGGHWFKSSIVHHFFQKKRGGFWNPPRVLCAHLSSHLLKV